MKAKFFLSCMALAILFSACNTANRTPKQKIEQQIDSLLKDKKATVGVAVLANDETVAVYNNQIHFPLLSVFKFHVGLAVLDKMDKIGFDGVRKELSEQGHSQESVEAYMDMLGSITKDADGVRSLGEKLSDVMPAQVSENLAHIMDTVKSVAETDFNLEFDPTLVRGMSYYTGTIFEVSMEGFGGSVAGGGRYDRMIGKFTGMETPACGFSIGFERIVTILLDNGFKVPGAGAKKAYLFEKGLDAKALAEVIREAMEERKQGVQVLVAQMNKNKKFQKEQLGKEGYTEFKEFYREALKN